MDRPDEARTADIFEYIPGNAAYPKPPLMPLSDPGDLSRLAKFGLKDTALARSIVRAGMAASGYADFVEHLRGENLEQLLRTHNLRLPGLFAPCLSASAALLDDPRPLSPFQRAATLVFGAYSLYRSVFRGELEPDVLIRRDRISVARDQALEMGQYPNLFSTSLLVEGRMPRLFKSVFEPQITVLVAGHMFVIQLGNLQAETWVEGLAVILERLAQIAQSQPRVEITPGLLTAADSRTQLQIFNLLAHDELNARSLRLLRRSLLTICLDLEQQPASDAQATQLAHSTNFANRWFHASLQLVIFGNAKACAIMNFTAYLDGNVMMRGAAEIQKRAAVYPMNHASQESAISYQQVNWNLAAGTLPPKFGVAVDRAQREIQGVLDTQDATFTLQNLGRSFFEQHKLNPIPAFILALQMAANQAAGRPLAIDQFVSLSAYRCMDVTTTQVSTSAVQAFAAFMQSAGQPGFDATQAKELLDSAIDSQVQQVRQARAYMPAEMLMQLYVRSQKGSRRFRAQAVLGLSMISLALLGQVRLNPRRDILVSHPELHAEVPVVGRPGIRLPFVGAFGLHYQIWPGKTVLTFMPGLKWSTPNAELVGLIEQSLAKIADLTT